MNVADDMLRGFNGVHDHVDRTRRRGIEDEMLSNRRNVAAARTNLSNQQGQINEMKIEDMERGQLKSRAVDDFRILQETGELPPAESYQEFIDAGMSHFSPWHYADQNRVSEMTDLKPVMQSIAQGKPEEVNKPENIARLNRVFQDEININVGEAKPELGGNIVKKEISRFEMIPESGGKVAVKLKVTLDNGQTYEEPMTVGRNANSDAPVKVLDARELMDDVMTRFQIGKFYNSPQGKEITNKMLSVLNPNKKAAPNLSQIAEAIPEEHLDEFIALASADPSRAIAFAEKIFTPKRERNGITVSPDGTVQIGGEPTPLQKPNIRQSEKEVVSAGKSLARLRRIKDSYDSAFLTYKGRLRNGISVLKDKAGLELTNEDRDFLRKRRRFTQSVNTEFNAYRKLITGAAAAVQELESLKKAMISEDLSPEQFESAFDTYSEELSRTIRINNVLLRQGLAPGTKQFGDELDDMFMSGEDDDWQERGMELEGKGKSDQEILQILEEEGYL